MLKKIRGLKSNKNALYYYNSFKEVEKFCEDNNLDFVYSKIKDKKGFMHYELTIGFNIEKEPERLLTDNERNKICLFFRIEKEDIIFTTTESNNEDYKLHYEFDVDGKKVCDMYFYNHLEEKEIRKILKQFYNIYNGKSFSQCCKNNNIFENRFYSCIAYSPRK